MCRLLRSGADPLFGLPWFLARLLGNNEIASLLPVSFDQDFLIEILKCLDYKIDNRGICFGFAHMAKHFIQSRQVINLNQWLIKLVELYLQAFALTQTELKKTGDRKQFKSRFKKNIQMLFSSLQKSENIDDKQFFLDLRSLFDGLYLYQNHSIYSNFNSRFSAAAVRDTLKIIAPSENQIEFRGSFSGVYSIPELEEYVRLLSSFTDKLSFTQPISLVLNSNRHAITIGYDSRDHCWTFADAGSMPLVTTTDRNVMAKRILSSLSDNKVSIFNSAIYSSLVDREKMGSLLKLILEDPSWKAIHEVTIEKIQLKAGKAHKYDWQTIATTADLKLILDKKLENENQISKLFTGVSRKLVNKFSLFMDRKTKGKYVRELTSDNQPLPIYQEIRK